MNKVESVFCGVYILAEEKNKYKKVKYIQKIKY